MKKVCGDVPANPVTWVCRGTVTGGGDLKATSSCEVEARTWWLAREQAEKILGLSREHIECVQKGSGNG